jgi:endonuclease/exonuclease/phosphatase family metal-dependent hydrolase
MKLLTMATWNMENLDDGNSSAWVIRKPIMKRMMQRINADIFLLQEINTISALQDLISGTDYENYHLSHTETEAGAPYRLRNLAVLSKWPIEIKKQYLNDLVPAPMWKKVTAEPPENEAKNIKWERPILHCQINLNVKTLHVVTVHLKSFSPTNIEGQKLSEYVWLSHSGWAEGYYISDIKRIGQALETRKLLDNLFKQEGDKALIVLGGDYNADIGSLPFKCLVGNIDETNNPDLRSTVLIPCELNVPSSQRFSLIHKGVGNMLDHIAVSQEFYPYWKTTSIFNELLPDKSIAFAKSKFPDSDHAPVITHFEVPDSLLP